MWWIFVDNIENWLLLTPMNMQDTVAWPQSQLQPRPAAFQPTFLPCKLTFYLNTQQHAFCYWLGFLDWLQVNTTWKCKLRSGQPDTWPCWLLSTFLRLLEIRFITSFRIACAEMCAKNMWNWVNVKWQVTESRDSVQSSDTTQPVKYFCPVDQWSAPGAPEPGMSSLEQVTMLQS